MLTKVLVIDDDSAMTDLMKLMLSQAAYDILTVASAEDAIPTVKRWKPDIVILDLLMPGIDGLTLCKEIRKFSQLPILILSALDHPGIQTRALEEGADDFLRKPVSRPVLLAHIKKLTWRWQTQQQAAQMI